MDGRRIGLGLGLVLVLAAGCGKKAERDGDVCAERMEVLAGRLGPLAELAPSLLPGDGDFEPLESELGSPIEPGGLVVEVSRSGGLSVSGQTVGSSAEVAERVQAEARLGRADVAIYLVIDRRAPADAVDALVAALPAERDVRVVVAGEVRAKTARDRELESRPSVRELVERTAGGTAAERASALAEIMNAAIPPCTELATVLGQAAGRSPAEKVPFIATELPRAIRSCGCKLRDLDVVEYATLAIFDAFGRPQRWVPAGEGLQLLRDVGGPP